MFKVIQSNSKGNAVLYFDKVLVDIGVSYRKLAPYKDSIEIVLLTHKHKDHINLRTLQLLQEHNPKLKVAGGDFMVEELDKIHNYTSLDLNRWYDFGGILVSPVNLYHDVPNYGYRIFKDKDKVFHATDTSTLDGISAKDYTIYAIEHNYCEERLKHILETSEEFEHGYRSQFTHVSYQEAQAFIKDNAKQDYEVIRLHESSKYKKE